MPYTPLTTLSKFEIDKKLKAITQMEEYLYANSGGGGAGTGSVTSVSVASTNGFTGTVATPSSTPVITLRTSITGLLKGNGTAISAATAGTDYLTPSGSAALLTGFPIFNQNTTGTSGGLSANITESQVTNLVTDLSAKQLTLVSGTNIKTVNGSSLLGSGDLSISGSTDVTKLPLAGGTMTGNLLATDNTYDIGASGATRFRTAYMGTSVVSPLITGGTGTISTLTLQSTSGSGTTGSDIIFKDDNTEFMRILNNGNVGIGIAAPVNPLDVVKSQNSNSTIQITNSTAGTGAQADFRSVNDQGEVFSVGILSSSSNTYGALTARVAQNYTNSSGGIVLMADNGSGVIKFATGGNAEKMRISANGSVGIGVTSPLSILHLKASTATANTASFQMDVGTRETVARAGTIVYESGKFVLAADGLELGGKMTAKATTTTAASLNLPAGTAPTSPVDGDMWREDNTNTGLKIRVNGITKTITLS